MKYKIDKIRKRDGRVVPLDTEKITNAIWGAAQSVGGKDRIIAEKLTREVMKIVERKYEGGGIPAVEHVQDIVEKVLIEQGHAKTAKAYILYREQHKNIREVTKLLRDITIVDDYLDEVDWRVRENSNMTYSLQGLNVHITSKVISNYWLNSIYPRDIRDAHMNGEFHIHDLGTLGPYCVGWDLEDLLISGFRGVRGKIESNAAKHFDVALMQIVNFMYTLQGEAAGAQALSNFDTLLAPFMHYDNLDYKHVKQSVQKFLFNMNVPTRVGFQTPFSNITMDLTPPEFMKDKPVIIGGELKDKTYGEFQHEMDMVNKAFAETMLAGDASGRPFTFPIPTYNVTKDFPWDKEELKPVWEMTAKYGVPYFANFINSDMKPDDVRSMCCRLRLDKRQLRKRGGGLFGSNPLTGSIGVVTINLPRIAYESESEQDFFDILERRMELAKESLIIKRSVLERFTENGLYPYSRFYLREVKKAQGKYWKNHFSTIGIIGMNDALLNFSGHDITHPKGNAFALKVLDFMRKKLVEFQEETGDIFNLEATPAEGTSYRLARIDKKMFPKIKVYNQERYGKNDAAPYYTNSSQLPVGFTDDIFKALEIQDALQVKYTGGTVLHGFLGEKMPSVAATKALVKTIAENFRLPYFTLTPTFSICPHHGYLPGEHEYCPKCDEESGIGVKKKE
jgi:anaerobic ribonucleoside-triphosphate reductase